MTTDTGAQADAETIDTAFTINRASELDLGGTFEIPPGDPVSQ